MVRRQWQRCISGTNALFLTVLWATTLLVGCGTHSPEPTLIVENGRVIVGDGVVHEEPSVVVAGDSILSVTQQPVEAPNARHIDASGKTVLPGLIDAHVHLVGASLHRNRPWDSSAVADYLEEEVPGMFRSFLANGVTSVRAMGDYWPRIGKIRDRVAAGELPGPRIVVAGPVVMPEIPNPNCRGSSFCESRSTRKVGDPKEAREVVQALAEEDVGFIKVISDARLEGGRQKPEVVRALVNQAHREGLRAVGHVDSVKRIRKYAQMGMDGFVHLPRNRTSAHRAGRLGSVLAKHEAPLTPTLFTGLPSTDSSAVESMLAGRSPKRDSLEAKSKHARILAESGVPVAVGSDWSAGSGSISHPAVKPGRATITEMKIMRWGGMSRRDIIQAATATAARALEMADKVGTLEAGKLADLIVVDGNPLEDLSALDSIDVVVQGGEVVADREARKRAHQ